MPLPSRLLSTPRSTRVGSPSSGAVLAACVLAVALFGGAASAQRDADGPRELLLAPEELQVRAAARLGELLAIDGCGPVPAPAVRVVGPGELGRILWHNRSFATASDSERSGIPAWEESRWRELGLRVLAAYEFESGTVAVSSEFPAAAARLGALFCGTRELDLEALLDVVLWHELAHHLQSQQHDLRAASAAAHGYERRTAFAAVLEGQAQWLARGVARSERHRAAFELFARSHEGRVCGADAHEQRARAACEAGFAYREGLAFFETLSAAGVATIEFRSILADPPRTIWHVEHPHAWRAGTPDPGEPLGVGLVDFARENFPATGWMSSLENLTREGLRLAFDTLEAPRADRIVASLEGSRLLRTRQRVGEREWIVAVLRFDGSEAAAEFLRAEIDCSRRWDAARRGGLQDGTEETGPAVRVRYRELDPATTWIEKELSARSGAVEITGTLLRQFGSLVFEVNSLGRANAQECAELAEALCVRVTPESQ